VGLIKVRVCGPGEFEAAVRVYCAAWRAEAGYPPDQQRENALRAAMNLHDAFLAVACRDHQMLGMGLLVQAREGSGKGLVIAGAGHVEYLYVRPEWWRRGVGKALLDRLTAEASSRRYSRLDLDVNADNQAALGLYRKSGFTPTGAARVSTRGKQVIRLSKGL
jgi:ribosomal protein S18 acetylase RimI-like enzyme